MNVCRECEAELSFWLWSRFFYAGPWAEVQILETFPLTALTRLWKSDGQLVRSVKFRAGRVPVSLEAGEISKLAVGRETGRWIRCFLR